jgi:hypothetical protein
VLLALERIAALHNTKHGRAQIDRQRKRIGDWLEKKWSKQRWIDVVPWQFRQMEVPNSGAAAATTTSYRVLCDTMLSRGTHRPTDWLSPCFLWPASDLYKVGVFLIVDAFRTSSRASYYHIGDRDCTEHIVLYSSVQHHEVCEWREKDVFTRRCAPGTAMYETLRALCAEHARIEELEPFDLGEDTDKIAMQTAASTTVQPCVTSAAARAAVDDSLPGAQQAAASAAQQAQLELPSVPSIAAHGELYDFISYTNVPQWIGMNSLVWNSYRIASQDGDSARQAQAVLDLLMLPQRVLTKLDRTGRDAGKRIVRTVAARLRSAGAELRARYNCRDPPNRNVELGVTTATLIEPKRPRRTATETVSSIADTEVDDGSSGDEQDLVREALPSALSANGDDAATPSVVSSSAPTVVTDTVLSDHDYCSQEALHCDPRDETDCARAFERLFEDDGDPDIKAVKRAMHLVKQGHLRKAAQTLHSTATMADLRQPSVQQEMRRLHPALPASSVLPTLPADAPQMILEDDDILRRIIQRSNNGSASGPSGWGGNMLSTLSESDICRAGIRALLRDIINGSLPEQARQYLLASRLVGLNKPTGGARPIAVGELFYRLAGIIAVSKVVSPAAALLAPHQYGVGVSCGAERIVHSLSTRSRTQQPSWHC